MRLTAGSMIALGVLGVLMSLLQGFISFLLFNDDTLEFLRQSPELGGLPDEVFWLIAHSVEFAVIALLLSVLTLIAGWGMLLRQRWALWCSVVMFWIGAACNAVGIWAHALVVHRLRDYGTGFPEWVSALINANYWATQISGAVFGVVFAVGFGWTAWKLGSTPVRAEFSQPVS